jgi:hypothetical protein
MILRVDQFKQQVPTVYPQDPAVAAFTDYLVAVNSNQFSAAIEPMRLLANMGFIVQMRRPSQEGEK